MQGTTMGLTSLGQMQTAQDANQVKEFNSNNAYFIMKNKRGRIVPVSTAYAPEAIKKGYQHTDGVIKHDDLTLQVQPQHTSPEQQLAEVAKAMKEMVGLKTAPAGKSDSELKADHEVEVAKKTRRTQAEMKAEKELEKE